MTPDQLERAMAGYSIVRGVDRLPRGHLRAETGFHYPDGSSIDVFVQSKKPSSGMVRLTDFGQTTSFLLTVGVKPWSSPKRKALLEDSIEAFGVRQDGGALELDVPESKIAEGLIRLGQACIRMSDLIFTRRASLKAPFEQRIEELLSDAELVYEENHELPLSGGSIVRVDFLVSGRTLKSALLTLSAPTQSAAHAAASEVFWKVHDLASAQRPEQRITVLEDEQGPYRSDDLARLEKYSTVVPFSDKKQLTALLAA